MQERYKRQISLAEIGEAGQQALYKSRVLVIGAGGLGSPALYYLCAAGIGTLGIADYDTVNQSNLNRQILHTQEDIGGKKTKSAEQKLKALNFSCVVQLHEQKLNEKNIASVLAEYDAIVDCVDTRAARLLVARAVHAQKIPLVEAGIEGFSGFVMSVLPGTACYGCLVGRQERKPIRNTPVLGATAGVAGSIQAGECVKLLLGVGEPLLNRALFFNLLIQEYNIIALAPSPSCVVCK